MSTFTVYLDETPVSSDRSAASAHSVLAPPAAPPAPVSWRAAVAVLGSMVFLIIALTVLLVQVTLVEPASAAQAPTADAPATTEAPATADAGSLAHW